MENEKDRQQYVMNDSGFIVVGAPFSRSYGIPWKYGQYEKNILDIALHILDVSLQNRNDPLVVSRFLGHGV